MYHRVHLVWSDGKSGPNTIKCSCCHLYHARTETLGIRDSDGIWYWFCSKDCKEMFELNPFGFME